jgi:hypothetical protein
MSLLIPGTNSIKDTGYNVSNSLRFDDASNDWLSKTFSSSGNRQRQTISVWIKRCNLAASSSIFSVYYTGSTYANFYFNSSDQLQYFNNGGSYNLTTNRVFRDTSAWYHILLKLDTKDSTADDRIKMYVNGVQETSFAARTNPGLNAEVTFGDNYAHYIGTYNNGASDNFDGYMSQFFFTTNVSYGPDSFGETDSDTGLWVPIEVSGLAFNTNAFYLSFEDSSALGTDDSSNSNNFSVNNLTSIDQVTDTPTNNFMTLNPLSTDSGVTLSNGNTESDFDASVGNAKGTIGLTSGRWYWEVKATNAASNYPMIGIGSMNEAQMTNPTGGSYPGGFANSYGTYGTGIVYANGSNTGSQSFTYGTGDIIGVYLDLESSTKTIKWYKNGSSMATYDITNSGNDYPFTCMDYNGGEGAVNVNYNFGNPAFSISSGNTDDNGYGNFEYSPNISTTKYYAVCTKNIAEFG